MLLPYLTSVDAELACDANANANAVQVETESFSVDVTVVCGAQPANQGGGEILEAVGLNALLKKDFYVLGWWLIYVVFQLVYNAVMPGTHHHT